MPKKSKDISFPWYSKFPFLYWDSREARDLDQAQTSTMNSPICLFWSMKMHRNGCYLRLSCNQVQTMLYY